MSINVGPETLLRSNISLYQSYEVEQGVDCNALSTSLHFIDDFDLKDPNEVSRRAQLSSRTLNLEVEADWALCNVNIKRNNLVQSSRSKYLILTPWFFVTATPITR